MKKLRIVFMGTPDFSVPILEALVNNYEVVLVVSQPDKEVGRKKEIMFSPVKKVALSYNIPVFQPNKIRDDYQEILDKKPDLIITVAYGQILPKEVLDYPKYGCINVHASLLPKLRGGAPIHHAIIDNYPKTGVTIMYMAMKMDAGDIISQVETVITDDDNVGTLHDRLSILGRDLLLKTIPDIIDKKIKRIKQDEEEVTYGYNIKREEEFVTFDRKTREVFNHIRGLNPHPGAYCYLDGVIVKLYDVEMGSSFFKDRVPGEISRIYENGFGICTLDGEIIVTVLQLAGKKKIRVKDYFNGIEPNSLIGKVFNEVR